MGLVEDLQTVMKDFQFGREVEARSKVEKILDDFSSVLDPFSVRKLVGEIKQGSFCSGRYWLNVGAFFYKKGELDAAIISLEKALEENVQDRLELYDYLASANFRKKRYLFAENYCVSAITEIFEGWGYDVGESSRSELISLAEICMKPLKPTPRQRTFEYGYLRTFYQLLMEIRKDNVVHVDFSRKRKTVSNPEGELVKLF